MSQAPASPSRETGGTDDGIKRIHLSSKLPTSNPHLSQGFQKQNEKHSKQNMHFGCISRIQGTQRIVSPVQSLQIFSSELLGVRRALQGSKLEVGCGHNQWHSTSVSVTCKPPKHTNTSFQFLVNHKYTFLVRDK